MANLLTQLKTIEVPANREWKNQTRDFLLSEMSKYQDSKRQESFFSLEHFKLMSLAWRPVAVVAAVAVFVLSGSGLVAVAARKAVPGDNLFVVKRTWEKINDYMTTDAARKTELASAVLETRVDDLQKVLEQETYLVSAGGDAQINNGFAAAMDEVKKQVEEVNDKFEAMQTKEKESGQRVVEAALALNERIRSYKQEIRLVKDKVNNVEAGKELDSVLNKVEQINSDVLTLLVEKHAAGEVPLPESDLALRVGDHVKQMEEKLAGVEEAVATTEDNAEDLKQRVDEAKMNIKKANEALQNNEYSLALTLSNDSNKILELLYGSVYQVNNDTVGSQGAEGEVKGATTTEATVGTLPAPKNDLAPSLENKKDNKDNVEEESEGKYEVNILQ